MRLKRLVARGFKSFADRTEFEFDSRLTGIIGPNGCGKSNVVDAIKWVLGDQRARSLRGQEMTDVIFKGAEGRQALGMAEVTITFEDPEGKLDGRTQIGRLADVHSEQRAGDVAQPFHDRLCRALPWLVGPAAEHLGRCVVALLLDLGAQASVLGTQPLSQLLALRLAQPRTVRSGHRHISTGRAVAPERSCYTSCTVRGDRSR